MQEHRTARPHDPATCKACGPAGPGHWLCQAPGCEQLAVVQARRHATQAEYDALPETFKPIDAVAMMAVYACDDDAHSEAAAPFCAHPEPEIPPCPACGASGDTPCTTTNGSPRTIPHAARPMQPLYDRCLHAHREDCGVFDGCQCTADDPMPVRQARQVAQPDHADGARSRIPFETARPIVEARDIPWWTVREYATGQAQDTTPALIVTFAELDTDGNLQDDGHGHEVLTTIAIPLDPEQIRDVIRL